MKRANQERALAILSPVAALVVWQLASDAGFVNQRYVPSPTAISCLPTGGCTTRP